jgi:hypothetical protein
MISAAELIGLSSRPETGVKRPCLVWMFLRELVSISLFAAVLGITFGSFVLEAIGMRLALLFMVIGCVERCRKARQKNVHVLELEMVRFSKRSH